MASECDPLKMCSESEPVEETTQHPNCKAVSISNTVFNNLPAMTSTTVFEKLPAFAFKLVYEDDSNSQEHQDPPIRPQYNGNPHVPPSDEVHVTQADLKKHQKICGNFEKNMTPNLEELKKFVSEMMGLIKQMASQYPTIFSVKPGVMVRLTHGDLENHQERWEDILQTLDVTEMKEHMLETMEKLDHVVVQIECYRKEVETLKENARHMNRMKKQQESLARMNMYS